MADVDLHKVAFPTLDDAQVATLARFGTRRLLRDGEHLFKAGDREYKFFVVERGAVEIVEHSSGETKRVTLHERHAFGGDVSLVTGRPALISGIARGDTEIFEIARDDIRRIMGERPALGDVLLRGFIARRELLVASDFQGLRVLGANWFVVQALHELYAPVDASTHRYYGIATAEWASRWPVEDLWVGRLASGVMAPGCAPSGR